jgi:hypothetical protein
VTSSGLPPEAVEGVSRTYVLMELQKIKKVEEGRQCFRIAFPRSRLMISGVPKYAGSAYPAPMLRNGL